MPISKKSWHLAEKAFIYFLLTAASCSDLHRPPTSTSSVERHIGKIVGIEKLQVSNNESRAGRIVVGALAGGVVGFLTAANTESTLGTSEIWRYRVFDGKNTLDIKSFSIVSSGDCVEYAADLNLEDNPIAVISLERCAEIGQ